MKSCLSVQLCKLRRGEFFFKELDGLLSYPWILPSPFPHNADTKISLNYLKLICTLTSETIFQIPLPVKIDVQICRLIKAESLAGK